MNLDIVMCLSSLSPLDLNYSKFIKLYLISVGLCKAETLMLVLELAPLGPLHKYLKKHL